MVRLIIKWVGRILLALWLLLLFFIGVKFAQKNTQPIVVDLIVWRAPEFSSGWVICSVFVLGVVIGVLAVAPIMIWNRQRLKRLKSKNARLQKNVESLPAALTPR